MTRKKYRTPKAVYQEVAERSEGICEFTNEHGRCGMRAEQMAHLQHRMMGGTTNPFVHSAENIRHYCRYHHDLHDGRVLRNRRSKCTATETPSRTSGKDLKILEPHF